MTGIAAVAVVACAATIATAATPVALGADGSRSGSTDRAASRAWSPFFEQLRPVDVVDPRRVIVSFADPSLGEWVAAGDRDLDAAARTAWLAKAAKLQQQRLDALALAGVQFQVEHRYLRVLNGASIVVHGDGAQLLRGMTGVSTVTPVRTMWPTAIADDGGASGAAVAAGMTAPPATTGAANLGAGAASAVTVAVLDTGLDVTHPAVAGRVNAPHDATVSSEGGALGTTGAAAAAGVTIHADPHGTAVAGAVLAGATKGTNVRIAPVQVLESRPARDGVETVLGDSDDLLAGLEYTVDPDRDGTTTDAADVAVIASTAPFAGFVNSPEDRAVRSADALGMVVVAASGNDGASGDAVGTIGSVAASDAALAIGAADLRGETPAADVRVRGGGVDETFDAAPVLTSDAKLPTGELAVVVVEAAGDDVVDYLDSDLHSRVGGAVALVQAHDGATVAAQVRAAADAGAVAVLVGADGASAAAGTVDVDGADIPAVGIDRDDASALREALAGGGRLAIEFSETTERNPAFGTVAGFSSGGPRLDGIGRPDALAPGVGMLVADANGAWRHASGTSIAAAWAAGQVASLRSAQPSWDPARVRAALLGSAIALGSEGERPAASLQGAGVLDADRAAAADWIATNGRVDFGTVAPGAFARRPLSLTALTGGRLTDSPRILLDSGGAAHGVTPTLSGNDLVLTAGDDATDGHVGGWLVLPDQGIRIPWSATIRDAKAATVPLRAELTSQVLKPVAGPGAFASSLALSIGGAGTGDDEALGLAAVQKLEVRLVDARGRDHGVLGGLNHALPGIYTFGLTGVDATGQRMKAGRWQLHVRYVPASDPDGAWREGPTATFAVQAIKRAPK
ncbi:MAG: peptidase and in, kexin, sedolisin [Thermoleophilia bacterium]|nr:peptidase and in, kexin, sedolisin [Thermoleophilia bacterium]